MSLAPDWQYKNSCPKIRTETLNEVKIRMAKQREEVMKRSKVYYFQELKHQQWGLKFQQTWNITNWVKANPWRGLWNVFSPSKIPRELSLGIMCRTKFYESLERSAIIYRRSWSVPRCISDALDTWSTLSFNLKTKHGRNAYIGIVMMMAPIKVRDFWRTYRSNGSFWIQDFGEDVERQIETNEKRWPFTKSWVNKQSKQLS